MLLPFLTPDASCPLPPCPLALFFLRAPSCVPLSVLSPSSSQRLPPVPPSSPALCLSPSCRPCRVHTKPNHTHRNPLLYTVSPPATPSSPSGGCARSLSVHSASNLPSSLSLPSPPPPHRRARFCCSPLFVPKFPAAPPPRVHSSPPLFLPHCPPPPFPRVREEQISAPPHQTDQPPHLLHLSLPPHTNNTHTPNSLLSFPRRFPNLPLLLARSSLRVLGQQTPTENAPPPSTRRRSIVCAPPPFSTVRVHILSLSRTRVSS